MTTKPINTAAGNKPSRRLFVYNGGFLTQKRVRRILDLSGWDIQLGKPGAADWIGVWGKSPTSPRGQAVAKHTDAPVLHVEDTFLRSVHPGRCGGMPIGLNLDTAGVHFDSSARSDLEQLLMTHALDDTALLDRARGAIERMHMMHLSKYNAFDPATPLPQAPYVLVIDQTRGDASIRYGGANEGTFREMLVFAQTEHPRSRVVIKAHPETYTGHRPGHFGPEDESERVELLTAPVSPLAILQGATAVYTVSSQMGFEAIFAGHKPRVFGQPFYAGWGLSQDENPVARRERNLSRAQLFAAAMILYPVWYDPSRDKICELEDAIGALEAEVRAWRADHNGYVALGMRLWKRGPLQQFFGAEKSLKFAKTADVATRIATKGGRKILAWASRINASTSETQASFIRIEDGFLRSCGLGAELTPPLSLVTDDLGIYYDPTRESRLERLITASVSLPDTAVRRAEALIGKLVKSGVSKYNLKTENLPDLPSGHRILVPGQVEDDASVNLGCGDIHTNLTLLEFTRARNPEAIIIYKPHPDVEAGLRIGKITDARAMEFADLIVNNAAPVALINACDEVWTMTSLLGFEALLRGKPATCVGTPFYAGWGLTQDLGKIPARRAARPSLAALTHAVLIDYPRYFDPSSNRPCPVEVVVERLAERTGIKRRPANRLAAKLQGLFASYAHLWR